MSMASRTPTASNPELAQKIQAACAASGLTPSELLTALGSQTAPAEVPGTFGDVAQELHQMITGREDKPAFFERLTAQQQGCLVAHLHTRGFRWVTISSQLGVTVEKVKLMVDEYGRQLGTSIMSQSLQTIVGDLAARHAERYSMAMEGKDYKAALAMDQAWVKMALDLGVVERAVQKHEVTHSLENDVSDEIERIVTLREKAKYREEQKALIERQVEETTEYGGGEA
jgi:hypothetical protein